MPNAALNNVAVPDNYATTATLDTGGWIHHVNLDVSNYAIYWQIKQANRPGDTPQMSTWQAEVYMSPGSRTLYRPGVTGVRVRNAVAGSVASATVEIIT